MTTTQASMSLSASTATQPLKPALRSSINNALLAHNTLPTIQAALLHECQATGFLAAVRARALQILRDNAGQVRDAMAGPEVAGARGPAVGFAELVRQIMTEIKEASAEDASPTTTSSSLSSASTLNGLAIPSSGKSGGGGTSSSAKAKDKQANGASLGSGSLGAGSSAAASAGNASANGKDPLLATLYVPGPGEGSLKVPRAVLEEGVRVVRAALEQCVEIVEE